MLLYCKAFATPEPTHSWNLAGHSLSLTGNFYNKDDSSSNKLKHWLASHVLREINAVADSPIVCIRGQNMGSASYSATTESHRSE